MSQQPKTVNRQSTGIKQLILAAYVAGWIGIPTTQRLIDIFRVNEA